MAIGVNQEEPNSDFFKLSTDDNDVIVNNLMTKAAWLITMNCREAFCQGFGMDTIREHVANTPNSCRLNDYDGMMIVNEKNQTDERERGFSNVCEMCLRKTFLCHFYFYESRRQTDLVLFLHFSRLNQTDRTKRAGYANIPGEGAASTKKGWPKT